MDGVGNRTDRGKTNTTELEELHLALAQRIEQGRGEALHIAVETELLAEQIGLLGRLHQEGLTVGITRRLGATVQLRQLALQYVIEHRAAATRRLLQQIVGLLLLAVEDRLQGQRLPHPSRESAAVLHHAGEMGANLLQPLALGFARKGGQRLACQIALRQQQRLIRMDNQRLLQQINPTLEGDRIPAVE